MGLALPAGALVPGRPLTMEREDFIFGGTLGGYALAVAFYIALAVTGWPPLLWACVAAQVVTVAALVVLVVTVLRG